MKARKGFHSPALRGSFPVLKTLPDLEPLFDIWWKLRPLTSESIRKSSPKCWYLFPKCIRTALTGKQQYTSKEGEPPLTARFAWQSVACWTRSSGERQEQMAAIEGPGASASQRRWLAPRKLCSLYRKEKSPKTKIIFRLSKGELQVSTSWSLLEGADL